MARPTFEGRVGGCRQSSEGHFICKMESKQSTKQMGLESTRPSISSAGNLGFASKTCSFTVTSQLHSSSSMLGRHLPENFRPVLKSVSTSPNHATLHYCPASHNRRSVLPAVPMLEGGEEGGGGPLKRQKLMCGGCFACPPRRRRRKSLVGRKRRAFMSTGNNIR